MDAPEAVKAVRKIRQQASVLQRKERSLSAEEKSYIDSHADFASYERVLRLYEDQR